jgi:putative oxygen-independent coproporphyrinogen III oxidase
MKDLSLYIHIPFCRTICVYCGFLTYANKEKRIDAYIGALLDEISAKSRKYQKRKVVSVYFGGGTPSLLEAEKIDEILSTIRKRFKVAKNAEITIECNPESVSTDKLRCYRKTDINRISLGVQSLESKTLWRVARPHTKDDVVKGLKAIIKEGFTDFGTDLIMGLPFQTLASFKKDVLEILSFRPPHLSFYFLSHDTKKIDLIVKDCPPEEVQVKMYKWLINKLKKEGYNHYEVSNYAQPGFECRHNLRYWQQREYLGLGLGAHSFIGDTCIVNEETLEKYINDPLRIADKVVLDPELKRLDYIMLNLRTTYGLNLADYEKRFGSGRKILKKAKPYLKSKMLTKKSDSLAATDKGFLFIDGITKELF